MYLHFVKFNIVNFVLKIKVGGLKAGCFKIGHTGGMLDNILMSKLYRPGRYVINLDYLIFIVTEKL